MTPSNRLPSPVHVEPAIVRGLPAIQQNPRNFHGLQTCQSGRRDGRDAEHRFRSTVVFLVLLARSGWGLSRRRRPVRPQTLGFQEVGYGLLTLALLAIGYRLGP